MKLNNREKQLILKSFPKIKLSYVKNNHKKVSSANMYMIIPKGNKYFAWFRYYKNSPVCVILEINTRNKVINNISIHPTCFRDRLCHNNGTILYGTIFIKNAFSMFSVEDIYYNKGVNLTDYNQEKKFSIINGIFEHDLKQLKYHNSLIFGLPIIKKRRIELDKDLKDPPYEVYCIQSRYFKNNIYYNERPDIQQTAVFLVKSEIKDDIYSLYYNNYKTSKCEFYSHALIIDYKTSVMMNVLFRRIKENDNLDYLEESDSDDDFENTMEDKYLQNVEHKMICNFNNRHGYWYPIKVTQNDISQKNSIINFEKNT